MGLEETLALTPALSPRRGGSTHSSRNFHALWCGIASWGLASAATVRGHKARSFGKITIKIGKKPFRLNFNSSGAGVRASVTRVAGTKDALDAWRPQWGLKYPME